MAVRIIKMGKKSKFAAFIFLMAGIIASVFSWNLLAKGVRAIKTNEKMVALTLDDAPAKNVREVLEILDRKGIKATFYVIGKSIEEYPEEMRAIVAAGHEVGNHSYSHRSFVWKPAYFVENEIKKTDQLIRMCGYSKNTTFRPPLGENFPTLAWYLWRNDIKMITWNLAPDARYRHDTDMMVKYAVNDVSPGSIIIMHPFCGMNCFAEQRALPEIIDGLLAKGYKFVTVGELLESSKK